MQGIADFGLPSIIFHYRNQSSWTASPGKRRAAIARAVASNRRSETEIAQRVVLTSFKLKGTAIWRRRFVIAFEDVGVGSVDALTMTAASASDGGWPKAHASRLRLAIHLAGAVAAAPRDRSADYHGAMDHPFLASFVQSLAKNP